MKFWSDSFENGAAIPSEFAFGKWNPETKFAVAGNSSPHFAWSELPEGTQSLALICHDPDVPSQPDDVNQEGKTVPASLPRVDFYHWTLIDIPTSLSALASGEFSNGITAGGKSPLKHTQGLRDGLNNYTQWFEGDSDMQGQYFGYDGPCPPWNDEIIHNYIFTLYALKTPTVEIDGEFYGPDVIEKIKPHILDQATWTGTYALNPEARKA